jgi:hypothetical protein
VRPLWWDVLLICWGIAVASDAYRFVRLWLHFRSDPLNRARYVAEADDNGIVYRSTESELRFSWSQFRALCETRRVFALALGRSSFCWVPKSALREAGAVEAFRELANRHVGRRLKQTLRLGHP